MTDESSVQELVARGLLDLQSPTAEERRKALEMLMARGASIDDLEANTDDLGYFASLIVNGGPPTMTRRELAARCGGDCFGPTVNLAARLVGAALPGELVVDDGAAQHLASAPHVGSREVALKGFDSTVTVVSASRSVGATGGPRQRSTTSE